MDHDPTAEPASYGVPIGRLVAGLVVVPLACFGGSLLVCAALRPRLPEPLATHWNASGQTNGTMTFPYFIGFVSVMALVMWVVGPLAVLAGRPARVRFRVERVAMTWCCGITAFLASTVLLTVRANVDQPTAMTAELPGLMILPMLGVGAIGALVGWALAGPAPELPVLEPTRFPSAASGPHAVAPVVLGMGEHPVWQRHLRSSLLLALSVAMGVVGLAMLVVLPVLALVFLVTTLATFPLATITVTVDGTGLTVRFGPLGWPRSHLALDTIASVTAEDIEPLEWGGWGYRMLPGKRAVVLRRGPAIVVSRTDGTAFAVTIDDPAQGAALLEAYRRRATGSLET